MQKISYKNQIFGTRKVIKDSCVDEDWIKINKPVPSEERKKHYVLTRCLNCGKIFPSDIRNLKRQPPKRCSFCSNIGKHYNLQTETNSWVIQENDAICNVIYNNQVVSFYIDKDNYEKIKQYVWRTSKKKNKYYVVTGSSKKNNMIYLHQLIFGKTKDGLEIDHIDGNSLNNRKNNLREVTRQENIDNIKATRIDNQIGIRGIVYNKKSHKYQVDFSYHNNRFYFKQWNKIEEAIYCRYLLEKTFNLHMLENNPKFQEYNFESINKKEIQNYIQEKISQK